MADLQNYASKIQLVGLSPRGTFPTPGTPEYESFTDLLVTLRINQPETYRNVINSTGVQEKLPMQVLVDVKNKTPKLHRAKERAMDKASAMGLTDGSFKASALQKLPQPIRDLMDVRSGKKRLIRRDHLEIERMMEDPNNY
jgi:hypothetical protein